MPYFEVDIGPLQRAITMSETNLDSIWSIVAVEARTAVRNIVFEVFQYAMDEQDPVAWPPEYSAHVLQVLSNMPIELIPSGNSIEVMIDLYLGLGDWSEIEQAYHYHALTENKDLVELPYSGEELLNIKSKRQTWWQDRVLPTGLWEYTVDARINTWGERAPEWLFLQYGNGANEPVVEPYPIMEEIQLLTESLISSKLLGLMEEAIELATRPTPAPLTPRNYYNVRDSSGRFTKR